MKMKSVLAFLVMLALLLPLAPMAETPFYLNVSVTPVQAGADKPMTAKVYPQGGKEPIRYVFNWHIMESGQSHLALEESNATGVSILQRPFGDSGWLNVWAYDALGTLSDVVQIAFTVDGSTPNPLASWVSFYQQTVNVGEELIGYAHTTGGEKPFIYSYYWDIIESGQTNNWKYVRTDKDAKQGIHRRLGRKIPAVVNRSTC